MYIIYKLFIILHKKLKWCKSHNQIKVSCLLRTKLHRRWTQTQFFVRIGVKLRPWMKRICTLPVVVDGWHAGSSKDKIGMFRHKKTILLTVSTIATSGQKSWSLLCRVGQDGVGVHVQAETGVVWRVDKARHGNVVFYTQQREQLSTWGQRGIDGERRQPCCWRCCRLIQKPHIELKSSWMHRKAAILFRCASLALWREL